MFKRNLDHFLLAFAALAATFSFVIIFSRQIVFLRDFRNIDRDSASAFFTAQTSLHFVSLILIAFLIQAFLRLRRRGFERQKSALNDRMVREIDFRETAINTHAIVSVTDRDGRIREVNENFEAAFGYTRDEVLGESSELLYDRRGEQARFEEIRDATQAGLVWTGEQRLRRKSGEYIYVNSTVVPQFDDTGAHVRNITIRTDVTKARLAEADRFLREMLEELQDEVYIYYVDTLQISYANRSARNRCEWSREELPQKRIADSAPNFDENAFRFHVQPLVDGCREIVSIEVMHPKGPVEISTRLQERADGRAVFVSVLRDTSWRKEIESAKVSSISTVSHELRAPLTSILGSLRLLRGGAVGQIDEQAASVVDIAQRNGKRLLSVVNDILDIEKIHANQMDFKMEDVELVGLLNEAIEMNRGYATEHGIGLKTRFDMDRAVIQGDANRLMQVLTNLLSNAVKFSPDAGVVELSASHTERGLRVSVRDTGPGIPPSDQKKLFKMFAQLNPVDGRRRDGTGLGLAIVKSILKRHQFRVGVNSKVGEGSEFYFDIPRDKCREEGGDADAPGHERVA